MDTTHCDVVLLDMTMPGRSGVSLIRELRRRHPGVRLLVLVSTRSSSTSSRR